jgi:hypothetical protein
VEVAGAQDLARSAARNLFVEERKTIIFYQNLARFRTSLWSRCGLRPVKSSP